MSKLIHPVQTLEEYLAAQAAAGRELAEAFLKAVDILPSGLGKYAPLPVSRITRLVALARKVLGEKGKGMSDERKTWIE